MEAVTLSNGAMIVYVDTSARLIFEDYILKHNLKGYFVIGHGLASDNYLVGTLWDGNGGHPSYMTEEVIYKTLKDFGHQQGQPVTFFACQVGQWQTNGMNMAHVLSEQLKSPVIAADQNVLMGRTTTTRHIGNGITAYDSTYDRLSLANHGHWWTFTPGHVVPLEAGGPGQP
jgi:hypothetical protein